MDLSLLIERAREFGLPERDVANAKEFVEHKEAGLALDTLIVQLAENSVSVDQEFVSLARSIADSMNMDWNEFSPLLKLKSR